MKVSWSEYANLETSRKKRLCRLNGGVFGSMVKILLLCGYATREREALFKVSRLFPHLVIMGKWV